MEVLTTTTALEIVTGAFTLTSTYSGDQNINIKYSIEFTVLYGTTPLENSIITIDGVEYTTNSLGVVSVELIRGDYIASIYKTGYQTQSYDFTITSSNLTAEIQMVSIGSFSDGFNESYN